METENYTLKEIESADIENIHKGLSNPDVTRFYDVHFPTIEKTEEQKEWYRNLKKKVPESGGEFMIKRVINSVAPEVSTV